MSKNKKFTFSASDLSAGLVVFLVALPLCLGIALASGAPLFAGIIAGVAGGIITGIISKSALGVSGPAAGLTVIVLNAITELGAYETFLLAVFIGGALQLILGWIGAGKITYYFPSSVIKGMLSAIGLLIILKQVPHLFGIDSDPEGEDSFIQPDGQNTLSELLGLPFNFEYGAVIIGLVCMAILIVWDKGFIKKNKILSLIPGPLLVVIVGVLLNDFFGESIRLQSTHLVNMPVANSLKEFTGFFIFPDWSQILNPLVWKTAAVIAIIASLETLLSVDAADRLDPQSRITPPNRELFAQGFGNMFSGFIGGIPLTQVIVRSSANVQAGGKSKMSTIFHGFLLLLSVYFIPSILNKVPLSALAAVLIMVGYKLAKPSIFKKMREEGQDQFIPFIVTIVAILFTNLLTGIFVGLAVGLGYVLFTNFRSAISVTYDGKTMLMRLNKDVFFYNRAELMGWLSKLNEGETLFVDGSKAKFIDHDIFLTLEEFLEEAPKRNVEVILKDINRKKINFLKDNEIISKTLTSE